MSYGLQISASGVFTALYRQDVFANNLANLETAGFKVDIPTSTPRQAARPEDDLWNLPSNRLLERLGGGALLNANATSFAQGSLRDTANPLDLAIQGRGFFVVQDGQTQRLTRDGRFTRDAQGTLVTTDGLPVMGESGPMRVPPGSKLAVDGDGTMSVDGQPCGRLRLVDIPDLSQLNKAGAGRFDAPPGLIDASPRGQAGIRQRSLEQSGTDEVKTLMDMTSASRDVEANTAMIREHDRLLDKAINTLGRV